MNEFNMDDPEIKDRIVAINKQAFCFVSYMPIVPGHLLICPIRVVETSNDLTDGELKAILELKDQVCKSLEKALHAEGFNFAWNEGPCAGQSVPHFHLHVVPRKNGDAGVLQYEPRAFLYRPGTRAESPMEELIQIAQLLKGHLETTSHK